MRDCFIFDLDGTLLHTLPDLVDSTNMVLAECGYPERDEQEILSFIGNGARRLIFQAVPDYASGEETERVLALWQKRYLELGYPKTKPFDGIPETLQNLRAHGVKLGVLSNKFDFAARENMDQFLPGYFDSVHGERSGIARKPDPHGLLMMIEELDSIPSHTVYVGDSSVDMQAACNAGAFALGVSWGYNPVDILSAAGANGIAHSAFELLDYMGR